MPRRPSLPAEALGGLSVALASLQFGAVVVLGKIATRQDLAVLSMLAIRFGIAAILLAVVLAATRQELRAARGEGAKLALLGVFGYAVEATLFFLAIERGTASAVTLLFFTYPALVALLSIVFGLGRPGRLVAGALAASIAGAGLVVTSAGGLDISGSGVAFALGSAAAFAFYLVGAEVALKRTSSTAGSLWVSASASIALAVSALVSGAELPGGARVWLTVAGMGAFTAGAFFCLFAGLRLLGAIRTSIVASLEPLFGSSLAVIVLGETLRSGTILGGGLILAGAVAASLARRAPATDASVP